MEGNKQLRGLYPTGFKRQAKSKRDSTVTLGRAVQELMDQQVSGRQASFASIARLWKHLLPDELSRHCKLDGVRGGQMKVIVDSPSYMHELRLCSSQLLEELQQHCPKARIKKIKFAIG